MSQRNITFAPTPSQSNPSTNVGPGRSSSSSAVVVGAGVFGTWTALYLLRSGMKVTLIDTWGPGNSRSSSGGETRLMRFAYGDSQVFFDLARRALDLWKQNQELLDREIFVPKEIMWFVYEAENQFITDSLAHYDQHNLRYDIVPASRVSQLIPQINSEDLDHVIIDYEGGFLKARDSCRMIRDLFVREGGIYLQDQVNPGIITNNRLVDVIRTNGTGMEADLFVWAAGPWLKKIFPEVLGDKITCTRQEVFYFGSPPGTAASLESLPCWVDWNENDIYYGIPGHDYRGFKIAYDRRGEELDPTTTNRIADPKELAKARDFLSHRFPELAKSPLLESRVCQYANTRNGNLILDQHPEASNLWLIGGGSGHGFKHGPAVGELACNVILGKADPEPAFMIQQ